MKQNVLVVTTILLSTFFCITSVAGQEPKAGQQTNSPQQPGASLRSYEKARKVLDDGIAAMGGLEALRGIKDFTLKEKGTVYARYQSPTPEGPFVSGPSEEILIVDNERGFLFDEVKTANGGFNNWVTTIIKGKDGYTLDMWSKTSTPIPNPSLNNFRGQIRRMPPFVLLEALDKASTLRWLGEDELDGKKQRVISVIRPDNQELSLYFDAQTNLLTRYEYLYADPMAGDSIIGQTYSVYRAVGKLKLPTGRVLYNSGGIIQQTDYTDVQINTHPSDSVFAVAEASSATLLTASGSGVAGGAASFSKPPKEKILFQGDMLNPAANGSIPIAQDVTISFYEKFQQLGLDVEKIYGVHGRAATPAELRASIEKRRASELKIASGQ